MATGSIKTKTDKGFGFISVEGSADVFFHHSACVHMQAAGIECICRPCSNKRFDPVNRGHCVPYPVN